MQRSVKTRFTKRAVNGCSSCRSVRLSDKGSSFQEIKAMTLTASLRLAAFTIMGITFPPGVVCVMEVIMGIQKTSPLDSIKLHPAHNGIYVSIPRDKCFFLLSGL